MNPTPNTPDSAIDSLAASLLADQGIAPQASASDPAAAPPAIVPDGGADDKSKVDGEPEKTPVASAAPSDVAAEEEIPEGHVKIEDKVFETLGIGGGAVIVSEESEPFVDKLLGYVKALQSSGDRQVAAKQREIQVLRQELDAAKAEMAKPAAEREYTVEEYRAGAEAWWNSFAETGNAEEAQKARACDQQVAKMEREAILARIEPIQAERGKATEEAQIKAGIDAEAQAMLGRYHMADVTKEDVAEVYEYGVRGMMNHHAELLRAIEGTTDPEMRASFKTDLEVLECTFTNPEQKKIYEAWVCDQIQARKAERAKAGNGNGNGNGAAANGSQANQNGTTVSKGKTPPLSQSAPKGAGQAPQPTGQPTASVPYEDIVSNAIKSTFAGSRR